MKKQRTILTYLGVWWRATCLRATHRQACWCGLVVGLTLACGASMAELTPITLKHYDYIYSFVFNPDGTLLATGSQDKTAKVWEMPSGRLLATLKHESYVEAVAFNPDGTLLATGSLDKTAKVWEMPSGRLLATLKHDDGVYSVVFNSDGTLLATRSDFFDEKLTKYTISEVRVWEMPSGRLLATLKHDGRVYSVAFSPDGTLLATRTRDDNTAKVWEMPSGKLLATLRHDGNVNSVVFSPDGTLLATGSTGTARVWMPNTDDTPALTEPPDGSDFVDVLPELKWEKLPNALYQVQVAKERDFSQVVLKARTDTESLQVGVGSLAPGESFWRVRTVGWNPLRDFGEWSVPLSFTVDFSQSIVIAPVITVTQTDVDFDISIEKAQNLYGFQFDLQFDPNVLEAVSVTEGDFLKSIGGSTSFMKPSIDNSAGVIKSVVASRMSQGEVDGAGVLATIRFRFKRAGTCPIEFTLVKLSNEQFQPIPFAYANGSITLKTTTAARFTVQPSIVDNQVVAKILIEDAVNLRGYSVDLEYPSAFELLDVSQGDFLKEGWQQTELGANTVRFSASKAEGEFVEGSGEIATLTFRIWEGGELPFVLTSGTMTSPIVTNIYTPELRDSATTVVASPNWEVNKDYVVDMQDIVILGIDFDKKIAGNPRPNPDVTRDGLVDLFDLVAVASHYPDEYSAVPQPPAAPVITKRAAHNLPAPTATQRTILQNLYDRVARYPDSDDSVLAVKRLLASLIERAEPALPQSTRLAQNYPNPFNPETWIPFELAEAVDVTVSIYAAKGQLVRTIALGKQLAGFYITPERAVYWDGRNDNGERIASGVYFYTFTAGTFTATRKLTVLK